VRGRMSSDPQAPVLNQVALSEAQIDDFARLLAQSVTRGNIGWLATAVLGPGALQAAGNDIADHQAFARRILEALNHAGRIPEAVARLRQEAHRNSYLTLGLNHILSGKRLDDDAAIQAFVNEYEPFLSAAGIQESFPQVLRTVCAVALGHPINEIVGSGFLINADLVMTNYHVIEPFLSVDPVTKSIRANGPGDQLFCFFDYLWEPAPHVPPDALKHTSVSVRAADDWLVYAREKLAYDGTDACAALIEKEYDYAVIRLARPVGTLPARRSGGTVRGWLSLPNNIDVLSGGKRIIVFQHPGKAPQQFDIGDFVQLDPSSTRVWYSVSTAKGSSGGAAVDSEGRLFALHNAEVQVGFCAPADGKRLNQGVRIDLIANDLAAAVPNFSAVRAPDADTALFWSLNDDPQHSQPIIGRTRFRELVLSMTAPGVERVIVVTGPLGSGLKYSIKLLRRTLGAQVPVAVFSPNDIEKLDPRSFIRALIDELGIVGAAGKPMPELQSTENILRWLRLDLPQWLLDRLTEGEGRDRSRYPAWVVINTVVPTGQRLLWAENLKDFVAALAGVHDPGQSAIDLPQLRWLFLGLSTDALPVSGVKLHDENLGDYTSYAKDYVECLQLAWRSIDNQAPQLDETLLKTLAQIAKDHAGNVPLRKALANGVREIISGAFRVKGE
jgi:hypothetical protein